MPHGASAADALGPGQDRQRFIRENLRLSPVPFIPAITLYLAHPGSGLARLQRDESKSLPPYWAFAWAGGLALARYILDHPELVRGKTVLDIGSGSGLVAIAAKLAGAAHVTADEIDQHGCAAIQLNAEANGVSLTVSQNDPLEAMPSIMDLVTAGDVFYDESLAGRMLPMLQSLRDSGSVVLVGDPGRAHLPLQKLHRVADYELGDFASPGPAGGRSGVYLLADA